MQGLLARVCPPRAVILAAAPVVAVACGPDLPTPQLERVSPARGWTGEDTLVTVIGSRFYPEVRVAGTEATDVDRAFSLQLLTSPPTDLRDVSLVSYRELEARVPAGVEPGRYDLGLESPEGDQSILADAFTVTSTRADRIDLTTPNINLLVGEFASVALQVEDPEGDEVPLAVPVRITVEAESGDTSLVDLRTGLDDAIELAPGVVEGTLGEGGRGTLQVTSESVDRLRVQVQGLDDADYLEGRSEWIDFRPLSVDKIELQVLPGDGDTRTTAGEAVQLEIRLLDKDGNPTRGELAWVSLRETCPGLTGAFERLVAVEDTAVLDDAYLTGATDGERCRTNRFTALATLGATALVDESEAMEVLAADTTTYEIDLGGATVEAGGTPLPLWVVARDTFGNRVRTHAATLSLRDDNGGLDTSAGIGSGSCSSFLEGAAVCQAIPIVAGPSVRIQAIDPESRTGWSAPFTVEPGPLEGIEVRLSTTALPAGSPMEVDLRGVDAFDNGVEMGLLAGNAPDFTDNGGTVNCGPGSPTGETGQSRWPCTFTLATDAEQLQVVSRSSGHVGLSEVFTVTNGPLGTAQVEIDGAAITAGDELSYAVQAEDSWGNPYTTGGVLTLELIDQVGELGVQSVPLSSEGSGAGTVRLIQAAPENRLIFQSGGATLGSSAVFSISPDDHAAYELALESTWAEVDTSFSVEVLATDQWGNVIPDHTADGTLSSLGGNGTELALSGFAAGILEADFVFDQVAVGDQLHFDDGTISASSSSIDAARLDCDDGPAASVLLDGSDERVLCLISGTTPSVGVSATSSTAGAASLAAYHLTEGDRWSRSTGPLHTAAWTAAGAHTVTLVVVDADGCADSAEAIAWVGPNDGEPVGPVTVSLGDTTLSSSSSGSGGQTTVSLSATDCAGDPASGGTLLVRAALGTLSSGSTTLVATGTGLALGLDSTGSGAVDWSVSGEGVAATAAVHAGVATGAAHGSSSAVLTGDETRPRVVEWWPVGNLSAPIDAVEAEFSEPLWASTVDASRVGIVDDNGDPVALDSLSLSSDGRRLTLVPSAELDPTLGRWELQLSSSLRDDAGNRLDGDWSGTASSGAFEFGDLIETAPAVTGCAPTTATFRPDGDAGSGPEAEAVEISAAADGLPSHWRVDVSDSDGERVAQRVTAATSSAETLSWDGRADGGGVLANDVYTVIVEALDDTPAPGASCGFSVRLDNHVRPPE